MNDIEQTLNGIPTTFDLEKIIGPPPPPPDGSVPFSPKDAYGGGLSSKEAKAAEKALDRSADAFAAGRVNKTLLRKFGQIAQTIPGAERIRLRKRRENGNLGYIGEYNFRDLASVGDMEVFIAKYAKPQFGAGEYDVTIIDQGGREFPGGSVWIEGAPLEGTQAMNGGMVDLVRDLVNRNTAPQPVQDPIETMRRAQALAKELKESVGNDPMVAMMAMQQLAPRSSGPDPMILSALERIAAKLEGPPAGAMPLPPPPPPEKSIDWIALGSSVVLPLLQMFQQNQQAQQQMQMQMQQQNMATIMSLMSNKDGLSTKDLLALMNEQHSRSLELLQRKVDEERPQNTIEDQMQALVKMKEFASAFAPPPQAAPQGASFWDALVALASSQDMAGALADRIRQRDAARTIPAQAQVVHSSGPPAPNRLPAPTPSAASQERSIPLPESLKNDAAKIAMAGDSASRVQATIEALVALQSSPHFNRFVMALLEATAKNEQQHALRGLGGWLKMLIENRLLTREAALAVLHDFEEHWDTIRTLLIERIPMLKAFAEQAAPAAHAEPSPAAVAGPSPASATVDPTAPDPSVPSDVEVPQGYEPVPA